MDRFVKYRRIEALHSATVLRFQERIENWYEVGQNEALSNQQFGYITSGYLLIPFSVVGLISSYGLYVTHFFVPTNRTTFFTDPSPGWGIFSMEPMDSPTGYDQTASSKRPHFCPTSLLHPMRSCRPKSTVAQYYRQINVFVQIHR